MPLAKSIGIGQVDYDASPSATSLRDNLITLGLMASVPIVSETEDKFIDLADDVFTDLTDDVFEDLEE